MRWKWQAGRQAAFRGADERLQGRSPVASRLVGGKGILANRGYDANWFKEALKAKGIVPCIPPKKNRKIQIEYDKTLCKRRHKAENMFGKLKDWRRVSMRYDRCAHTFFSATCIAVTVIFYLN